MKRNLSPTAVGAWFALACMAAVMALVSTGCGSASQGLTTVAASRAQTGSAVFTVKWPARTPANGRLIPVDSNSIIVTLTLNGSTLATQVASRPAAGGTSTITFPTLPVGDIGVTAIAVPDTTVDPNNPTVHGTPQATGSGTLDVLAGKTATVTITMGSTIASVVIVPSGLYMQIGTTAAVSFEALDAAGDMVLVSPTTVQWSIANTTYATVTPDSGDTGAVVSGIASGDITLTVTETESGQSNTIPVSVRGPLASVAITTVSPSMDVEGVGEFGYVGKDSAGNVINKLGLPTAVWSSSAPSIASISPSTKFSGWGECTALSVGAAQGATTATCTITVTVGAFSNSTTLTVNAGPGGPPIISPTTVSMPLSTPQYIYSETSSPLNGLSLPTNVTYSIVIPAGGTAGSFGTLVQGIGYCIYTTPATKPTVSNSGGTSTVSQIEILASDGTNTIVTLL